MKEYVWNKKIVILNLYAILFVIFLALPGCGRILNLPDSNNVESISFHQGKTHEIVDNNIPAFTDEERTCDEAFETYSELDSLGRCGVAFANICTDIMPTEPRGEIGQIKPTGWHTVKYDIVDGMYLYNRCHLIGYQLAGENANEKNLITGTRYMNVSGMLPFEDMVADYVDETGNHVLYRVTPIYEGDNLIASAVQMEAYSVEDDGEGICFNVKVYNSQPGIVIDYANGDSWLDSRSDSESDSELDSVSNNEMADKEFVVNTNTKKYHIPSCSSVTDIKEHNKLTKKCSEDELLSEGYAPCSRCNP